MDQLTDYINGTTAISGTLNLLWSFIATLLPSGGPKLRKWYGEGELPVDGGNIADRMPEPEDIAPEDIEKDAILVTDADSATGEQIILQLILARQSLRPPDLHPLHHNLLPTVAHPCVFAQLSLIHTARSLTASWLCRLPVKIITQNAEEAKRGWGPYVTAFAGDLGQFRMAHASRNRLPC